MATSLAAQARSFTALPPLTAKVSGRSTPADTLGDIDTRNRPKHQEFAPISMCGWYTYGTPWEQHRIPFPSPANVRLGAAAAERLGSTRLSITPRGGGQGTGKTRSHVPGGAPERDQDSSRPHPVCLAGKRIGEGGGARDEEREARGEGRGARVSSPIPRPSPLAPRPAPRRNHNALRQVQEFRNRGFDVVALLVLHQRFQMLRGLGERGKTRGSRGALEPMDKTRHFPGILPFVCPLHGGQLPVKLADEFCHDLAEILVFGGKGGDQGMTG